MKTITAATLFLALSFCARAASLVFNSTNLSPSADLIIPLYLKPAQRFTTDNSSNLTLVNLTAAATIRSFSLSNMFDIKLRATVVSDQSGTPNSSQQIGTLLATNLLSFNGYGPLTLQGAVPLEPLTTYWVIFDTDLQYAIAAYGGLTLGFPTVAGTSGGQGGWLHATNDYVSATWEADVTSPWSFTAGRLLKLEMYALPGNVVFSQQPHSQVVAVGENVNFSATLAGNISSSWQWRFNRAEIPSATNTSYTILAASTNDAGAYDLVITSSQGSVTSSVATLTVVTPPTLLSPPSPKTGVVGSNSVFTALADGLLLNYQWQFEGADIPNATDATLVLTNIQPGDEGDYAVIVTNIAGAITSPPAPLTVLVPVTIGTPPPEQTAYWGKNYALQMPVHGTPPFGCLWLKDGVLIAQGTNATLQLTDIELTDGGTYTCVITNILNATTSAPVHLTINPAGISLGLFAGVIIDGAVGKTYGIQYTTAILGSNSWVPLTNVTLTQPVQIWVDTTVDVHSPGNQVRFYRVMAVP
ncbi:MAG TPA: immunoglobulin domain-containing protein [Candidatus Dormibacteraeota bacterium]|nr:immunoglobulin domain-containing protein [Candidatus Dormibacteraeota bacterium]